MYRFALIGGGWRAEFYARAALALPDRFSLIGTWMRNPEKNAEWTRRFGGRAAGSIKELAAMNPEFIVVSLPTETQVEMLEELLSYNIPLLLETPLGRSAEALEKVRRISAGRTHLINTAEQYLEWPLYRAWTEIINAGLIGNVNSVSISALHGYHAASLIRAYLGAGFGKCRAIGQSLEYPIVKTGDRGGVVTGNEMQKYRRDIVSLTFENGKHALYDFTGEQYHSLIRERHAIIDGDRGQIDWDTVRYVTKDGIAVTQKIQNFTMGVNNNNMLCLINLTMGERVLYSNPFTYARLNDDEISVAVLMDKMGRKSRGEAIEAYSFEESMRDAEIANLMNEAAANPFTVIEG